MSEGKKTSAQNLLDVDLDAIVVEGKKENRRNAKILIAVIVAVLAIAIIGVLLHKTAQSNKYQKAISAIDSGEYDSAITMFQELGTYRDSAELLEDTEFAKAFTASDLYSDWEERTKDYLDSCIKDGYGFTNYSYNVQERTLMMEVGLSEEMEEVIDFNNLAPNLLVSFVNLMESADNLTQTTVDYFISEGYNINCQHNHLSSNGELLYSTRNGETTYTCIEVETAKNTAYEEIYAQVTTLVDEGEYWEAFNYCTENSVNDFYELDYKDLADYYYYVLAMCNYGDGNSIVASECLSLLKKISIDFKDVRQLTDTWTAFASALDGVYEKPYESEWSEKSNTSVEEIEIIGSRLSAKMYPKYSMDSKYWYFYTHDYGDGKIALTIEDESVKYATAECGVYTLKLTPSSEGLNVEWRIAYNQEVDQYKSGTYVKES